MNNKFSAKFPIKLLVELKKKQSIARKIGKIIKNSAEEVWWVFFE